MKEFSSLEEFRQLPLFKTLSPYKRKSIINIGNAFQDTKFNTDGRSCHFVNDRISLMYNDHRNDKCQIQHAEIAKVLDNISDYNYCIQGFYSVFSLYRFSLVRSSRNPEYLYHSTDIEPDQIINKGIKRHYSMGVKAFPPLVFVGTEPCWKGKYVYKIKTNQPVFIDTNMDWQARDVRPYLCLREDVSPEKIVDVTEKLEF
jgi:hypothetical protein